jgi:hypothetical protein
MGIKRAIGDLRELHQSVVELFDDDRTAEAEASLQIARSAQRFSHNTKEVVDDKLSFSATLMRAGEVQAANRLLAEVEHEVREEEAALFETVNEVKVAQSMRRARVTRLRLARMLAVAMLGSALLTFSAAGMAVAGFLRDRAEEVSRPQDRQAPVRLAARDSGTSVRDADKKSRRLRIGDVKVLLTKEQFKTIKQLTGGQDIDSAGLADLLSSLPATLASRIQEAITVAEAEVAAAEPTVETVVAAPSRALERKKRAAKRAAAAEQEAAAEEEATPEPTPADEEKPNDTETPAPEEEEEGGDSGQGAEEEGGDGGLPGPLHP